MAAGGVIAIFGRLKELGCPALEGVCLSDAEDIQKLLFSPSSHRLDILEWICVSVYPPLREQFSSFNKESQSGLKIKGMAKLGYDLTLCRADDLDLIEGKACVKKQLHFLQQLVAVIPAQTNLMLSDSISDSSSYSSTEESFQEIARKNEEFIKQVFSSPDLQAVLNPESHPWSSDIKPLLLGEEKQQKRALLSMTSHEKTLLKASEELEETAAALENLRAQCSFLQGSPTGVDPSNNTATALQSLKLIVSDYSQLLTAFEQVYENELQKHCERPAPKLSPCDPLFQAVHHKLLRCMQELQGLAQVTKTSECIMATVQRRHEQKVFWNGSTIATLPSKLEELQQKYKTIHATLKDSQRS
ncbi:HAUS augmin-like complex subunit 7 isoform X1 [Pantherophis guttatus]|uniref:HAUS augmin-like complex subunit 7 isoform X1 n=1 Tax=Pantherophis guttatus TaxID=94885 RepID=A0ABM3YTM6_PANGU|nr:HAUS augmin-like complex subunit 7 isoform X1 [Pantherophis guttatus]